MVVAASRARSSSVAEPSVTTTPIEDAWTAYVRMVATNSASEASLGDLRMAFFGGAVVAFSILRGLVPPDHKDAVIMSLVQSELGRFGAEMTATPTAKH